MPDSLLDAWRGTVEIYGHEVAKFRKMRGLTPSVLAEKAGRGKSTVEKWESAGVVNADVEIVRDVAEALGVVPEELLTVAFRQDIQRKLKKAEGKAARPPRSTPTKFDSSSLGQPPVARRVYAAAVADWAASWRLFDSQHDIRIEDVYVEEVLRETAGGLFITTAHGPPVLGTTIMAEVGGNSKRSGENPLVWSVSGEAGVGKSTLFRQWTVILARTTGSATTGRCPLFVPLRHLSRELKSQGRQRVTPESLAAASRNVVPGVTENVVLAAFKESSEVVYLLDGLDEMDSAVRPLMVEWLAGLSKDARAVVSLRPQIAVELQGLPRAVNYRVCDFSTAQIDQFVRQWFRNDPPLGEKFIATVAVSPRVREVAAIPLLLTGLCLDTETAGACGFAINDNSRAVYRRVVAILFAEWDASKVHRRTDPAVVALGLAVFAGLAVRFPFDASFGLPDLRAEAELHAPRFGTGPAAVDELINRATATGRLLIVEPTYGYAFAHRAFHDFFFAEGVLALSAGEGLTS